MLLTRDCVWGKMGSVRAGLLLGACGWLVTGCSNAPSIGGLAAAGGQPGQGGAGAADAGQGDLRTAGSGGTSVVARTGVETDLPAAGSGDSRTSGEMTAAGGNGAVEPKHYPGQGFIVHEWGTDTIVVGSNGSLQRGLHHEEEDLPAFVYDRMKAGTLISSSAVALGDDQMERPYPLIRRRRFL